MPATDATLFDQLFGVGVISLNVVCLLGCMVLLYFRFRSAGVGSARATLAYLRWFIVAAGALSVMMLLFMHQRISATDRYTALAFYAVLPFFAPMVLAGLVALLMKR